MNELLKIEVSGTNGKVILTFQDYVHVSVPWEDALKLSKELREIAIIMKKGGIKNY